MKVLRFFWQLPREALIWTAGLATLALLEPGTHYSICPLSYLDGIFCPGCGLGRSIALLFRGEFLPSFHTHPLGLFAVIVLSYRIYHLTQLHIRDYGKRH